MPAAMADERGTDASRISEEWQMIRRLIDRYRRARKTWMLRIADSDSMSDARCASCNEPAPPAPIMSHNSDIGRIARTWRCTGCGNEWITSTEVPK
jgi:hypothetical protein